MKVLFVTSEVATVYKRGGLGDVSYSLPVALCEKGVGMAIAMPHYTDILIKDVHCIGQLAVDFNGKRELVFVFQTLVPGTRIPMYLFRHPLLNDYNAPEAVTRFAFFSKAVAEFYLFSNEKLGGPYDIIHVHDWHTALVPLLLGERRKVGKSPQTIESSRTKTIFTIHNLLYQGNAPRSLARVLGVAPTRFHEFSGQTVKLLREGMEYADAVTTVSPTYAKEIRSGVHGAWFKEVFTKRRDGIIGILNGINADRWDPRTDKALPVHFHERSVGKAKKKIKSYLQQALRLPQANVPLFGFVGRLEWRQKGVDLIASAVSLLPKHAFQLVLLGTGGEPQVARMKRLARKYPDNIAFVHTFDERLARRIYAGSDVMLVPSKFEPCGLTQMIAMRYGTLPLVRKTGGLADSVKDKKTGFVFGPYTKTALAKKMEEVIAIFNESEETWHRMQKAAMRADFSWDRQAGKYVTLYKRLLDR